jgi:hypothetical protein
MCCYRKFLALSIINCEMEPLLVTPVGVISQPGQAQRYLYPAKEVDGRMSQPGSFSSEDLWGFVTEAVPENAVRLDLAGQPHWL